MAFFDMIKQFLPEDMGDTAGQFFGGWSNAMNDRSGMTRDSGLDNSEDDGIMGLLGGAVGKTLGGYYGENGKGKDAVKVREPNGTDYRTRVNVEPGRTQGVASEDADRLSRYWYDRLTKFAQVERDTGLKLQGK